MKKCLLMIAAAFVAVSSYAQKVTFDFTQGGTDWGMPVTKANGVTEGSYTKDGYTISVKAAGQTSGKDNLAYFNWNNVNNPDGGGYFMFGKQGATFTLPAFDFAVGAIKVTGTSGASEKTGLNVFVGETAVSTETAGLKNVTHTYAIAEANQAAGTVYTLKVTSNHNAQFTKIEIFEVGDTPETPDTPGESSEDYTASLTDSQGNWTFEDITLPEGSTYVWLQTSQYGMKATAHIGGTNYPSESYLVSPAIVLGDASVLTFEHAHRFGVNAQEELTLWIREEGKTTWDAQLTIPTYSDGTSWSFVPSGDINLAAYAGKAIQLGWRYTSSAEGSATWEVKNVKVTNAQAKDAAPVLKDPSNTMATAYTITEAKAIIDNRSEYDMSKEVYVKGIITEIKSIDVSQYVRAQYYIGETVDAESTIQVYNGYYLDGKDFTANDQIKVGDEVIVLGKLTLYGTTYEIDQNNKIVSLNGITNGIAGIQVSNKDGKAYDLTGRIARKDAKGIVIVNGKKVVK